MPKVWNETIEAHRQAVREAILDSTADLVRRHGPLGVTMSQIATEAGIGRATLYKYFPDIEAVLLAWHERQVADHLRQLTEIRDRGGRAGERLEAVLRAYAGIAHARRKHPGGEIATVLHRGGHVAEAHQRLRRLIRDLLDDAGKAGDVRDDIPADELAAYCLHALDAAGTLSSKAAVGRLVALTLTGLTPAG